MQANHSTEEMNMKTLIKLEEVGLLLLSLYLFLTLDYAWWWFPLLFFLPAIRGEQGGTLVWINSWFR